MSHNCCQRTWKARIKSLETESLKRHWVMAWNMNFSVQRDKKEEEEVQTQLSYFFNGKHGIIEIVPPFFRCPCFPGWNSLLHFQQMTHWGYWTILLVIVAQWVWGSCWYSLYRGFLLTNLRLNWSALWPRKHKEHCRLLKCTCSSKMNCDDPPTCVFVNTLTSVQLGSNPVNSFVIPSCDTFSHHIRIVQLKWCIFIFIIYHPFQSPLVWTIMCVHTGGSSSSLDRWHLGTPPSSLTWTVDLTVSHNCRVITEITSSVTCIYDCHGFITWYR